MYPLETHIASRPERRTLGRPTEVALPPGPPQCGLGYFRRIPSVAVQLCYVDESGKADTLTRTDAQQQPVVVIAGISLPERSLTQITHEWIELKRAYLPVIRKSSRKGWLDGILKELKGTTLRRGFRTRATVRQRQQAIGLIDGLVNLLERHDCRILGRIWVKELDARIEGMHMHFSSLQFICGAFHAGLGDDERGMVVVDSQTYQHNHQLAHSVFTQRFARKPSHERLVDMPVFGHSDNHAGLQIADLLCSAVLAPIACAVYGGSYASWNTHCDSGFLDIRERYGERLERLTYDWNNSRTGRVSSSIVVHDPTMKRSTRLMWGPSAQRSRPRTASRTPARNGRTAPDSTNGRARRSPPSARSAPARARRSPRAP